VKIGVFSDTHDRLETVAQAVDIFRARQVDGLVHCGDWVAPFTIEYFDQVCGEWRVPVHSVFGNNEGDIRRIIERSEKLKNPIMFTSKQTLEVEFEGRKIVVYHGQDKSIMAALIKCQEYDAVFTGHTHEPRNELLGKTLVLNPGSTAYVANSRIIDTASVAIYDPEKNEAEIVYLEPLNLGN